MYNILNPSCSSNPASKVGHFCKIFQNLNRTIKQVFQLQSLKE